MADKDDKKLRANIVKYKLPLCPDCGHHQFIPIGSVSPWSMFDRDGRLVRWERIVFQCAKCDSLVGMPRPINRIKGDKACPLT